MKVTNMQSPRSGRDVPNQFVIECKKAHVSTKTFQSYETTIAQIADFKNGPVQITLDRNAWNYSRTTAKYRNQFLGETTQETERKIKSGEYVLADLNG